MKKGTDGLFETVFSPETAFLESLVKIKEETYVAIVCLSKIQSMDKFEKMQAQQFLETVDAWSHKMQGYVAGRQLIRKPKRR